MPKSALNIEVFGCLRPFILHQMENKKAGVSPCKMAIDYSLTSSSASCFCLSDNGSEDGFR